MLYFETSAKTGYNIDNVSTIVKPDILDNWRKDSRKHRERQD